MKTIGELYGEVDALITNGEDEEAIKTLERLMELYPGSAKAHYDIGILCSKLGDNDKAWENLKKSVEYEPDNVEYLKTLADFYYVKKENPKDALSIYMEVLEMSPEDTDTLFKAGNLNVVQHNYKEALKLYKKLLDIEPWHMEAFEFIEKLQQHLGVDETAEFQEGMYQKAQEYVSEGKIDAAIAKLEELVGLYPQYASGYNDLGVLYNKSGNDEKALRYYERAVELEPYNRTFQKNLAVFYYLGQGAMHKALEIYLNLLKSDPEDVEVLMIAGDMCNSLQRVEHAKVFYNRVMEIEPWNLEASERLGKMEEGKVI